MSHEVELTQNNKNILSFKFGNVFLEIKFKSRLLRLHVISLIIRVRKEEGKGGRTPKK